MNGITWLDCLLLILLVALTVRGILRGTIAQVFAFLGLVLGAWALVFVGRWIGQHWHDARPIAVFFTIRWLVAVLAGLAVAAAFQWWGDLLAKAAHDGPFGWIDRLGGGAFGAAMGLTAAALFTLLLLQGPVLAVAGDVVLRGVCSRPLVHGGAEVTRVIRTRVPWGTWLHHEFRLAARRLGGGHTPARAASGH